MKTIDPIFEIEKFRAANVTQWPQMMATYDRETLHAILGLLLATNFFITDVNG